jgi:hypothetical protein
MLVRLVSAAASVYGLLVRVVELIWIVAFYLPVFNSFSFAFCL